MTLKVIIVGGGIGGLGAASVLAADGHQVIVLESASSLTTIGAGIALASNAQNILTHLGIDLDSVRPCYLNKFFIHKENDVILLPPVVNKSVSVHRADLHLSLWEAAKKVGADIHLDSKVTSYMFEEGKVTVQDGTAYYGDLIIAADGMKSFTRRRLLSPNDDIISDLGYTMYRTTIPMDLLKEDLEFRESGILHAWNFYNKLGKYAIFYPISGGNTLNIVLKCESDLSPTFSDGQAVPVDCLSPFFDCSPLLGKIISLIKEFPEDIQIRAWKASLLLRPLENWVHANGKVVFVGDACHGMTPGLGQGAAQALEDVAVLHTAIRKFEEATSKAGSKGFNKDDLYPFLKKYEHIRKKRVGRLVVDSTACFLASFKHENRLDSLFSKNLNDTYNDVEEDGGEFSVDPSIALVSDDMAKFYYSFDAIGDAERQFT